MKFFRNLVDSPVQTLNAWQETRVPWAIMSVTMVAMVLIAHYVFQEWLYMAPCEQCVYIRYGNLVVALGGLIALINPRVFVLRLAAYAVSFYGLIFTMICSWKLMNIHDAVHSDDPTAMFGIQGCSAEAHYPFDLPLAKWAPGWFQQTGDCGYDSPMPPEGVDLSGLRGYFVELYQSTDGWYLFPQWHFMDMAECCMLACVVAGIILLAMFVSSLIAKATKSAPAI